MKKVVLIASLCSLTGNIVSAQSNVAGLPPLPAGCVKPTQTKAIPWSYIAESNILWSKRVWRDIDTRQPGNSFIANAPANSRLASVMVEGFLSGAYKAYSNVNDQFTTPLSQKEFIDLLAAGSGGFDPALVTKYCIKEDWLFLENEKRIVVRIVGIAPLMEIKGTDGTVTGQPAFWLYYPDTRNYFAQRAITSKEHPYILNWDEAFESRQFESSIVKVVDTRPKTN